MPLALCASSHSPLIGLNDPTADIVNEVDEQLAGAKAFAEAFDPELVVVFGPDHYNGFLYDLMPSFCVGAAATSVGDYGLPSGPLAVDRDAAYAIACHALDSGIDVALSEAMRVDHGFVQPLLFLFDSVDKIPPLVPVFVNCVAEPLGPVSRARRLGEAVGRVLVESGKRVLVVGSGGLSHDPPVPRLAGATPEIAARITHGRNPSAEQRRERETRTVAAAGAFAAGSAEFHDLNPEWDALVLDMFETGDITAFDEKSNDWFVGEGGRSAHEIRTWIAAYAALSAQGSYEMTSRYYRPIKEWFAGFAVTTATQKEGVSR